MTFLNNETQNVVIKLRLIPDLQGGSGFKDDLGD